MTIERMSLVTSTDPDSYSGGVITSGAGVTNILYTKYPGNKVYASQRPALEVNTDPSDDNKPLSNGRGIIYWDSVSDYYIVLDDTIYKGDYTNPIGTITGGRDKVFFSVVSNQLVLIDPVNNSGWYINSDLPEEVNSITDADFPGSIQGKQLAGGSVSLDGYLFVMTTDGFIYNSNLNEVSSWNALDFISTDVSSDGGIFIVKHHNHVCAIGENSIQFFYDAGNPVGTPLQLRQDISYLTGAVDINSVADNGDNIMFLGRSSAGTIGLHRLENFKLIRASNNSIDRYINDSYNTKTSDNKSIKFILSSSWFGQNLLCFISSVAVEDSSYRPLYTLVYDATNDLWANFDTEMDEIGVFAAIGSADSTGSSWVKGSLLFLSGAVTTVKLTGDLLDSRSSAGYFEEGYIEAGYITGGDVEALTEIRTNITTVELDDNRITRTNQHRLSIIGTTISAATDLTPIQISWTDDRYRSFNTPRDLDTGFRRSIPRLGSFRRRAYSIDYCGEDLLKLEALEFDNRSSEYA